MRFKPAALMLGLAFASVCAPAAAEDGDYAWWEVVANFFVPPGPDRPVTTAERLARDYPLLGNPAGFHDGFAAGRYWGWQTVQLAPGTGAMCGNGSPYKFFVNRAPNTRNTLIFMEPGGACWDYDSCSGATKRGARNPNGIPDDYMSLLNPSASLVSPFVMRVSPTDSVKTQGWNIVYLPYCTGDIYYGDRVAVYPDPNDKKPPLIYHHNGLRNQRAVVAWLRDHLPRPTQLVQTGCSAGGTGSLLNYEHVRNDLAPSRSFLIDDSGPIYSIPVGGDPKEYPSIPLFAKITESWGLDRSSGPIDQLQARLGDSGFTRTDPGALLTALARKRPDDRLGMTHFWQDLNYSSYSYERFFPEIANAPDRAAREKLIHEKWAIDTARLKQTTDALPNVGGYFPQYRAVNESHCDTILDFKNGDIQDQQLELGQFVDNVLNGQGPVKDASENNDEADRKKPFNLFYALIDALLGA